MNKLQRVSAQAFIWLVFSVLLWNSRDNESPPILNELFKFLVQIGIIGSVVYFIAPQLYLKRKKFLFLVLTISVIILGTFFAILVINETGLQIPSPQNGSHLPPEFGPPGHEGFLPEGGGPPRRHSPSPFWNILLLFGTTYSIAIFWESMSFAMKKEEETIRNKAEHIQTELKLLKSQINPHFLFNSLNNIYALSVMDSDKTQQSISYLSDMLRYVLYECEQPLVPLKKEIDYINNYIKLFSLKSSKPFSITTKFDVENSHFLVAPMLFIPFVENALKHGNIEQRQDSFINISIDSAPNEIVYIVENSFDSKKKQTDATGGIGLRNVKKRLDILYADGHYLEVNNTDNSYKIKLILKQKAHV
jgi:sensor histidine kinase YesM